MARRSKIAPAAVPFPALPPKPAGPPWHEGRTFYSCLCSAQSELTKAEPVHPDVLDCWNCGGKGSMRQWVPSAVKREREAIIPPHRRAPDWDAKWQDIEDFAHDADEN